jgi:hypothetical protein
LVLSVPLPALGGASASLTGERFNEEWLRCAAGQGVRFAGEAVANVIHHTRAFLFFLAGFGTLALNCSQ